VFLPLVSDLGGVPEFRPSGYLCFWLEFPEEGLGDRFREDSSPEALVS
jgi:hypothetical protein